MNDIVLIRNIRPSPDAAAGLPFLRTGEGPACPEGAIFGFASGDFLVEGNYPSLAAEPGLKIDAQISLHDFLRRAARVVSKNQIVVHWLLLGGGKGEVDVLVVRGFDGE